MASRWGWYRPDEREFGSLASDHRSYVFDFERGDLVDIDRLSDGIEEQLGPFAPEKDHSLADARTARGQLGPTPAVFTGDLPASNHAASSLDPFALWTGFPVRDGAVPPRLRRVLRQRPDGNRGRCACREPNNPADTAGTLRTFTVDR